MWSITRILWPNYYGFNSKRYDTAKDGLSGKIGKIYHIEKYKDPSTGKESETYSIIKEGE